MSVSVIIPCLDGATYLEATLLSVCNQTHRDVQIILVDNGSTDGSLEIARRCDEVEIVELAERGASRARLAGVERATGDHLLFLDADDLIDPHTLAFLAPALEDALARDIGNIACCPWYRLIYADEAWKAAPASCPPRGVGQDDLTAWLTGWYQPPCSVLWSREAYERSGGWDPTIGVNDDGDVMMRGLASGNRLHRIEDGAAFYRRLRPSETSLSDGGRTKVGVRSRMTVLARLDERLERVRSRKRYAPALSAAYEQLAEDAAGVAPATREQALEFAARYRDLSGRRRLGLHRWSQALGRVGERIQARTSLEDGGTDRTLRPEVMPPAPASPPTEWPLVSVIIPAHNRERTIGRTIASVLAQNYPRMEVFVIDDGSTDGTGEAVSRVADDRLRLLSMETNRGAAAARNVGIRQAHGKYVALVDSDDEWMPGKLRLQVATMEGLGRSCGLLLTGIETIDANGSTDSVPAHQGWVHNVLLVRNMLHGGGDTALIRREVFLFTGGFDTSLPAIEDWDFFVRLSRFFEVRTVDAILARYFDHAPAPAERTKRLSTDPGRNRKARQRFFDLHMTMLRRQRVDHLFLLASAERGIATPSERMTSAMRDVGKAIARRPLARFNYRWLLTKMPPLLGKRLSNRIKNFTKT